LDCKFKSIYENKANFCDYFRTFKVACSDQKRRKVRPRSEHISVFAGGPADDFADPARWNAFNASIFTTNNFPAASGGVLVGDSVFWVPQDTDFGYSPTYTTGPASVATIYNTSRPFASPTAWSVFNLTLAVSNASRHDAGACDCAITVGRFLILCGYILPGHIFIHDISGGGLRNAARWSTFNISTCTGLPRSNGLVSPVLVDSNVVIFGMDGNGEPMFWQINLTLPDAHPGNCSFWTRKPSVNGVGNADGYIIGTSKSWNSGQKVGKYIFWTTGVNDFVRYDTTGGFISAQSWSAFSIDQFFNSTYGSCDFG
jgi:hypothetical protein